MSSSDGRGAVVDVEASIAEQGAWLARRTRSSGLYRHEVAEFEVARRAHRTVVERLGVREDLGSTTSPESRNIVRRVRLADGSLGVLKVVGNTREPGEGEVLAAWHRRGLPCAEPLSWGYERVAVDDGRASAAWLLTRHLPGEVDMDAGAPLSDRVGVLLELLRPFHASGAWVASARSWEERLAPHLREVLPRLRAAGLDGPPGWRERLCELSGRGRVVVHADPAGINTLVAPDGSRTLIDPPGAVVAAPAADAGQVAWHAGGPVHLELAVDAACDADPTLVPPEVAAFAAFNLVVWAGYELADHAISGRGPTGTTVDDDAKERAVASARALLDQCGRMLAWR